LTSSRSRPDRLRRDWEIVLEAVGRRGVHFGYERVRCDGAGFVYVADPHDAVVTKVDADGRVVLRFDVGGVPGGRRQPRDVAVGSRGDVFVADWGHGVDPAVHVFSVDGAWRSSFTPPGAVEALAVDSGGGLYLHIPASRSRITKCDERGSLSTEFGPRPGRRTRTDGARPAAEYLCSVAVGRDDSVYFAPSWIYDVVQFSAAGAVRRRFRRPIREKIARVVAPDGSVSRARSLVIFDAFVTARRLAILRAVSPNDRALVDLWPFGARTYRTVELAARSRSIAGDDAGRLYSLITGGPDTGLRLTRYTIAS
jgi:hypothetical protein